MRFIELLAFSAIGITAMLACIAVASAPMGINGPCLPFMLAAMVGAVITMCLFFMAEA
jgi:hypothetical protein